MNFVKDLLDKIKSPAKANTADVRKSDAPVPPAQGSSENQQDEMSAKVIHAFTDGTLDPSKESVEDYLRQNGVAEEQVADMAALILQTYADSKEPDGDEGKPADSPQSDNDGDELAAMKSGFAKLVKNVNELHEKMDAVLKSSAWNVDALKNLLNESSVMKSTIANAAGIPVNDRKPVMKSVASQPSSAPARNRSETIELIQKGISAGKLKSADLIYYNTYLEISESTKKFIEGGVK